MTVIAVKAFRGMVPRMGKRLLAANQAQRAQNLRITSGRLDPLRAPVTVSTISIAAAIRSMFRYRHFTAEGTTDNWLVWSEDVDVALSPLANDQRGTFYFTSGSFEPRISSYESAISGSRYPAGWFALGVPSPTVAPTVVPSGGTGPTQDRAYLYTFVTPWGEESGPSPASALVSGNEDATWAVSDMQAAPPNGGTVVAALANTPASSRVQIELDSVFGLAVHESITFAGVGGMTHLNGTHRILSVDTVNKRVVVALATAQVFTSGGTWARGAPLNTTGMVKRIYRTAGTNPAFLYVGEVPVASATFNDNVAGENLGETLATLATLPPPKNLTCITFLPNGCAVGLADNELCFSDPYMPYSWPLSNRYSFSGRGVAIVKAGNSVIVLTDSQPILFTGSDPEAMSPSAIETYAPCVSKRGAVDVGGGALYPSFDGLWLVTPGGAKKITQGLYRDNEWKALKPETFQAAFFDGQYFAHYQSTPERGRLMVLDVSEPDSVVEVDEDVGALYSSELDGRLYIAQSNNILMWEGNGGRRYELDWLSREYQLPRPTTFAWAQVFAEFSQIVPIDTTRQAANAALLLTPMMGAGEIASAEFLATEIAGSLLVPVTSGTPRRVQFTVLDHGVPIFTKLVTSEKPFRLPTGYRSEVMSIQISASVPTFSAVMASTVDELREVAP